jgi:hypothetical protein
MAGTSEKIVCVCPGNFSERFSPHHRTKRNQENGDVAAPTPAGNSFLIVE